ncbi:MAG: RNA polymerase sigma factor [Caldimonas sp.]
MRAEDEAAVVACIPSLRRYARGLTADRDRADDLVQDTLEKAWRRFSLWQRRAGVRAWMFGIMHNQFVDQLRAERSRPFVSSEGEPPDVAQRATQSDRIEVLDLERSLRRLAPEQREVLLLVGVEELSYREVALAVGVPIGTVMSRLSRARERLRSDLQGRPEAAATKLQRVK